MRVPSILLVSVLSLSLSCAPLTGPAPPGPIPHQGLIVLSVALGTGAFLSERPALAPLVWRVARDAAATTEGALDVTQLGPTLALAIDRAKVSPEYRAMLQELVRAILTEVQGYIAQAKLTPTQVQLVASEVFAAMERAAMAKLGGVVPVVVLGQ